MGSLRHWKMERKNVKGFLLPVFYPLNPIQLTIIKTMFKWLFLYFFFFYKNIKVHEEINKSKNFFLPEKICPLISKTIER